ncbi:hypothetical protein DPMN_000050 [Dreissena polymorpha]|uniref:Uncharacterized protein n=1 Tax=Dreissena polymorpha TaxID=45954 RepID=A0A9D4MG23_DREPO|nr:hypothetical protein DPMN_000050 [Dreissena polymorpha]
MIEALKSNEQLLFDPYCKPKRRVFRGKGDTIAIKLANDIHILIGVMEVENYSTIKGMMGCSTRSMSVSNVTQMSTPKSIPESNISTVLHCKCALELKRLIYTVSSLQADMLLTKKLHFTQTI